MKRFTKTVVSVLCLAMLLTSTVVAQTTNTKRTEQGKIVLDWMSSGAATAANTKGFLKGKENRPTDQEIKVIMELANTYFECHGLGGTHLIVIKDQAKQEEIMAFFKQVLGLECSGTVLVLVMQDGIKDQAHHVNQYFPGTKAQNGGNPEYWNMYYGIYEAGWANAYLNIAAAALGYRTRTFGAINVQNTVTGKVEIYGTGGNWDYIRGGNWKIDEFMKSKDGTRTFDHFTPILNKTIPLEGNVTLLSAVLIGKINEPDAMTSATKFNDKQTNYDIWD
jgi:hypothetical protein